MGLSLEIRHVNREVQHAIAEHRREVSSSGGSGDGDEDAHDSVARGVEFPVAKRVRTASSGVGAEAVAKARSDYVSAMQQLQIFLYLWTACRFVEVGWQPR